MSEFMVRHDGLPSMPKLVPRTLLPPSWRFRVSQGSAFQSPVHRVAPTIRSRSGENSKRSPDKAVIRVQSMPGAVKGVYSPFRWGFWWCGDGRETIPTRHGRFIACVLYMAMAIRRDSNQISSRGRVSAMGPCLCMLLLIANF